MMMGGDVEVDDKGCKRHDNSVFVFVFFLIDSVISTTPSPLLFNTYLLPYFPPYAIPCTACQSIA
jgi:hypothetical protein